MKVAVFYDSDKLDTALSIKEYILSCGCDTALYNEKEIWNTDFSGVLSDIMSDVTHTLFIPSKDFSSYPGFIFFLGYSEGNDIPVIFMETHSGSIIPKNILHSFTVLKCECCLKYFETEKKRFDEIQKKEKARSKLLEKGYSLFNANFIETIISNKIEAVKLFIEAGFNPSECDCLGTPVLSLAVRNRCTETVKLLIDEGASIDLCSKDRNYSALMDAAQIGEYESAKMLLEHGANPDIQSKDGQTALIFAVGRHDVDMTALLVKYKADYDIKDSMGLSALGYAKLFKNEDVINALGNSAAQN